MFSLVGTIILVIFSIVRPFDVFAEMRGLPILHLASVLAILGYLLDLRTGLLSARITPVVRQGLVWMGWMLAGVLVSVPGEFVADLVAFLILFVVFYLVAACVQSVEVFGRVLGTVVLCALWVSIVCVHQSHQPFQCVVSPPDEDVEELTGVSCDSRDDCGDAFSTCARVGLLGITSYGGRARYTGRLKDPNEVAMFVAASAPLGFAWARLRPTRTRKTVAALNVLLGVITVIETQSRGGLLVLGIVIAQFMVRRFGVRKSLAFVPPALLVIGVIGAAATEREDADESSDKRLGCMLSGVNMVMNWPIFGVGYRQFTQYHDQTAHNAYVLAAAEGGFPALILWGLVALKAFQSARLAEKYALEAPHRDVGAYLRMALIGLFVGIFFLSFAYHELLWIAFALCSAFSLAVVGNRLELLKLRVSEVAWMSLGGFLLLLAIYIHTTSKL